MSDSTRTVIRQHDDELSIRQRTCQQCRMLLRDAGEFHPYEFCLMKRADSYRDPWEDLRVLALRKMPALWHGFLTPYTPLIRETPDDFRRDLHRLARELAIEKGALAE